MIYYKLQSSSGDATERNDYIVPRIPIRPHLVTCHLKFLSDNPLHTIRCGELAFIKPDTYSVSLFILENKLIKYEN